MNKKYGIILTVLCFGIIISNSSVTVCQQTEKAIQKYTVKQGDTLWDLSKKFYGDALKWPKLLENNTFISDHRMLIPGQVLSIPSPVENLHELHSRPSETVESMNTIKDTSIGTPDMAEISVDKTLLSTTVQSQSNSNIKLLDEFKTSTDKSNVALELLIASINDQIKTPDDKLFTLSGEKNVDKQTEESNQLAGTDNLPIFSLIFISQANTREKLKYFVNDKNVYMIDGTQLVPSHVKPSTNLNCDKARKVAEIVEKQGKYMGEEKYESGLVYHIKRMLLSDGERYYNYILTNVNEHFLGFATLSEPVDVLHIRIFSDSGYIYITDKGIQGLPGYFFAADALGNQIKVDPNDTVVNEKYEKALDLFLSNFGTDTQARYDPNAAIKLNKIFD
ncbi:MAG: LysM peptidoglycan-binding domain-containing protein [Candidatus Latescibacteria bacterium]|nr:LysM peptidoglycan-binding domain-containing protein [Candidatus Latescibacterota bacterium]